MSGGFFRGTTADQDTRFSNKQAKLLKTQKFPAELEHLVDVSKVKMDVIKPWIAKRVTEFLGGFEDEVLINFIYGLLEGKEINGKAVQIQLTGFMEKNTGKFMKELWALLISAQNNVSGVPQQFLDAKEEETRKKKAETDRITDEIQKRKDRENEQEKRRKTDGGLDDSAAEETKRRRERRSGSQSGDENGAEVQNGFRGRNRSPRFANPSDRSPSHHRGRRSRSISKSYSNSRSHSKGRSISKSISPRPRRLSISPETARRTSQRSVSPRKPTARGSITPRQRSHSRSLSDTRRRSPSPLRRRRQSPIRRSHRSPSPFKRRSRSPLRRRSPPRRRRSPSPRRRRSPFPRRRRSPSPIRQRRRRSTSSPRPRSPVQRKQSPLPRRQRSSSSPRSQSPVRRRYQSPVRRRSPQSGRRRSPSPYRRGSPLTRRNRSPIPVRRRTPPQGRRKSPVRVRRRSPSRSPSRSNSSASRGSPPPIRDGSASPFQTKSPRLQSTLHGSPTERNRLLDRDEPVTGAHRPSMAMSPQRDHSDISRSRRKAPSVSPSPEKSPDYADSPKQKTRSFDDNRRLATPYASSHKRGDLTVLDRSRSPPSEVNGQRVRQSSPPNNKGEFRNSREGEQSKHKSVEGGFDLPYDGKKREFVDEPPSRLRDTTDLRKNDTKIASLDVIADVNAAKKSPPRESVSRKRQLASYPGKASKSDEKTSSLLKNSGDNSRPDALVNSRKKRRSPSISSDSESEGSDKRKVEVSEKRKHRRSSRREAASDDSSSDSEIEDRKEAKRRKKDEKKLRKEDRRRRRDEKRRRREEKRANKRKRKDTDDLSSDLKKNEKTGKASNGGRVSGKYSSGEEEIDFEKKKLEKELREKALEMHRAKKGIHH